MIAVLDKLVLFGGGLWDFKDGWIAQYNDTYIYYPGRALGGIPK